MLCEVFSDNNGKKRGVFLAFISTCSLVNVVIACPLTAAGDDQACFSPQPLGL